MANNFHYVVVVNIVLYFYLYIPVQAAVSYRYVMNNCNSKSNVIRTTFTGENASGVILSNMDFFPDKSVGLDCNVTIEAPRNNGIILRVENISLPREKDTCLDYIEIIGMPNTFAKLTLCKTDGLTLNSSAFLIRFYTRNATNSLSSLRKSYFHIIYTTYDEIYPCYAFRCYNSFCISNHLTCNKMNNCGDNSDEWDILGGKCGRYRETTPFNFRKSTFQTFDPTYNVRDRTIKPPTVRPITITSTTYSNYSSNNVIIYIIVIPSVLMVTLIVCACGIGMRKQAAERQAAEREAAENIPPLTYPIGPQRPTSGATAPNASLVDNPFIQQNYGGAAFEIENPVYVPDLPPPYPPDEKNIAEVPPPPYNEAALHPKNYKQEGQIESESNPRSPSGRPVLQTIPDVDATIPSASSDETITSHPVYHISFPRRTS